MLIWKSVVGKLWITIIGLFGLVLLLLSLFLGRTVDQYFSNPKDTSQSLESLIRISSDEMVHTKSLEDYVHFSNQLLLTKQTGLIVVTDRMEIIQPDQNDLKLADTEELIPFSWKNYFSARELKEAMGGKLLHSKRHSILAIAGPFMNKETGHGGAIIAYQSLKSSEQTQDYITKLFVYAAAIGLMLTTFFAFFLLTRISQPILEMKRAADQIIRGDYSRRVVPHSNDEIGLLGKTFNHMAGQLEETIQDLNQEKEHLSSVLRSMADAVIVFDADGGVILANPQGQKIIREWRNYSWSEAEIPDEEEVGSFCRINQIPEPLSVLFHSLAEDHSRELTTKLQVDNGVWSVAMAPLYTRQMVRGAVAVLRDVTEESRLEKLRKDFVANVSHELRTPLSMLQGYSEALLDDIAATPEERQELVQVIHDESLRMGRLVKDLLDLARMEAGHTELRLGEVNAASLINRMKRKFAVLAKERDIQIKVEIRAPGLMLPEADEDRLEQVLTNLIDNAMRHSPAASQLTLRLDRTVVDGKDSAIIEVGDQGHGIHPEDLPYVFERFYKADKARTRGISKGTGLGLAIVRNIVEAHHGKVKVSSTVGKGTTFSIILPIQHEEA